MPGKAESLTAQELRFIRNLRKGMTKQKAALEAGYGKGTNIKSASVAAAVILKRPRVKKALAAADRRAITRADITTDRVLQEWARIAFADGSSMLEVVNGEVKIKPVEQWDEDEARAIASMETKPGGEVKLTLSSKVKALAALTRMLQPEIDEDELEDSKDFEVKIGE